MIKMPSLHFPQALLYLSSVALDSGWQQWLVFASGLDYPVGPLLPLKTGIKFHGENTKA